MVYLVIDGDYLLLAIASQQQQQQPSNITAIPDYLPRYLSEIVEPAAAAAASNSSSSSSSPFTFKWIFFTAPVLRTVLRNSSPSSSLPRPQDQPPLLPASLDAGESALLSGLKRLRYYCFVVPATTARPTGTSCVDTAICTKLMSLMMRHGGQHSGAPFLEGAAAASASAGGVSGGSGLPEPQQQQSAIVLVLKEGGYSTLLEAAADEGRAVYSIVLEGDELEDELMPFVASPPRVVRSLLPRTSSSSSATRPHHPPTSSSSSLNEILFASNNTTSSRPASSTPPQPSLYSDPNHPVSPPAQRPPIPPPSAPTSQRQPPPPSVVLSDEAHKQFLASLFDFFQQPPASGAATRPNSLPLKENSASNVPSGGSGSDNNKFEQQRVEVTATSATTTTTAANAAAESMQPEPSRAPPSTHNRPTTSESESDTSALSPPGTGSLSAAAAPVMSSSSSSSPPAPRPEVSTRLPTGCSIHYDERFRRHYYMVPSSSGTGGGMTSQWEHPLGPTEQADVERQVDLWYEQQKEAKMGSSSRKPNPQLQHTQPDPPSVVNNRNNNTNAVVVPSMPPQLAPAAAPVVTVVESVIAAQAPPMAPRQPLYAPPSAPSAVPSPYAPPSGGMPPAAAAAATPWVDALPPGWEPRFDYTAMKPVFVHVATGAFTHDRPTALTAVPFHPPTTTATTAGVAPTPHQPVTPHAMAPSVATSVNQPVAVPPLPDGWEERVDPRSGRTFYLDHRTKSTTWVRPTASNNNATSASATTAVPPSLAHATGLRAPPPQPVAAPQPSSQPVPAALPAAPLSVPSSSGPPSSSSQALPATSQAPLPPGWEERVDASGRTYYVDHNTKRTSWKRPPS